MRLICRTLAADGLVQGRELFAKEKPHWQALRCVHFFQPRLDFGGGPIKWVCR